MGIYQKFLCDVIFLFDLDVKIGKSICIVKVFVGKCVCKVKQYKNLYIGEVIEIKGGNYKILKEWKVKWGFEVVESWVILFG